MNFFLINLLTVLLSRLTSISSIGLNNFNLLSALPFVSDYYLIIYHTISLNVLHISNSSIEKIMRGDNRKVQLAFYIFFYK